MVGHAEAVWIETEGPPSPEAARSLLGAAPVVGDNLRKGAALNAVQIVEPLGVGGASGMSEPRPP